MWNRSARVGQIELAMPISKKKWNSKRALLHYFTRMEKETTAHRTKPISTSQHGTTVRQLHTLFNFGAIGGLSDGELLEMFKGRRGEAAESAFAVLMERHGPMVLNVCQQVLRDPHDADDAFQATFLILLQKASLLSLTDSLGPWLHGVALRVSFCARSTRARRRTHEQGAGKARMTYAAEGRWDDLGTVLHEEIQRLPHRFRTPVVLCWLEGYSTEAAGRRLRCPQGTVLSRLSRARDRLRKRLARRGVTLAGGVLGTPIFTEATCRVVPEALMDSTIQTVCHFLARNGAGKVTARVASLTKEVLITMMLTKVKVAATVLLMIGTLMTGVGVLARQETGANRTGRGEPEAATSALTNYSDNTPTTLDRVSKDLDVAADHLARQIRETVAVLARESNPDNGMLALHFRDQLNHVEADVRKAQEHLAGWLGPDSTHDSPAKASVVDPLSSSPRRKSNSLDGESDLGGRGHQGSDAHQSTLRYGGYVFSASPTGNKAIAYDPVTRTAKSVQLNATKEHPLKITPVKGGDHVQLVALQLQGSKITRVAVFDLTSGRWLPMDLSEPVKGDVKPAYMGHGGTAYDLGQNFYTFTATTGKWDHFDVRNISDDVKDESASKVSTSGKTGK